MKTSYLAMAIAGCLGLAACGGDDAPTPTPTPGVNLPPTITNSQLEFTYAENGTDPIVTLTVNDEATQSVTLSLSGTDSDDFTLQNGTQLNFGAPPDFENPTDADGNNVYLVTVTATDAQGNSSSVDITVTVTDIANAQRFIDPLFAASGDLGRYALSTSRGVIPVRFMGPEGDTMRYRPLMIIGGAEMPGVADFGSGMARRGYVTALVESNSPADLYATAVALRTSGYANLGIDQSMIAVAAPGDAAFGSTLATHFAQSPFVAQSFTLDGGMQPVAHQFYGALFTPAE